MIPALLVVALAASVGHARADRPRKVDRWLVGTWCAYPLDEPQLGDFARALAIGSTVAERQALAERCAVPPGVAEVWTSATVSPPAEFESSSAGSGYGPPLLTFGSDGSLVGVRADGERQEGTYWVTERSADRIRIVAATHGGQQSAIELWFVTRDRMVGVVEGAPSRLGFGRADETR